MDVFAEYEDFVDLTHRAFNSKATWLAFCASQGVEEALVGRVLHGFKRDAP